MPYNLTTLENGCRELGIELKPEAEKSVLSSF